MHGEDEQGFHFKLISSSGQELHLTAPTHEVRLEWTKVGARVRRPLQGRRKKMHRVGDHFSAVPLARWAVRLAKWEVPYDEGSQWAIKKTAI